MEAKPTFTVLRVTEWNYTVSRALGAPRRPERDTPKTLAVRCNACGQQFIARESQTQSEGTFCPLLSGAVQIYCSGCDANDTVEGSAIPS